MEIIHNYRRNRRAGSDTPRIANHGAEPVDGVDYEFIERSPGKASLLQEKKSLLARIAEIDSLLKPGA